MNAYTPVPEFFGYSEKCGEFGSDVASRLAIPRDYPNSQFF
jgi:hypothetical protein